MGGGQRLLPGGLVLGAAGRCLDAADCCADVGFGAVPFGAGVADFVLRESFLQGRFGGALQLRPDRRAHRRGRRAEQPNAGAQFAPRAIIWSRK